MVTKEKKQDLVEELVGLLRGVKGLYLVDYSRMTVKDSNAIRAALTQKGVKFKVAKNTLIVKALQQLDAEKYNGIMDSFRNWQFMVNYGTRARLMVSFVVAYSCVYVYGVD